MFDNFDELEKQLKRLAPTINAFESEAVQLKIVELIFDRSTIFSGSPPTKGTEVGSSEDAKGKRKKTTSSKKKEPKTTPAKSTSRPGPGKMVDQLIGEKFFDKPKGVAEVVQHCKEKKVLSYNNSEIAVSLGRAVKSGKLKREKNNDEQFIYSIS